MIIFDIEADNLLEDITKIHCLSYTYDGKTVHTLFDYDDMRELLETEPVMIAHNCIRYDFPAMEKILGVKYKGKVYDTLPMSWVFNHDRSKHGLEGYGEEYGVPKPKVDDWENLTPEEYAHRCEEDVKINARLWFDLIKKAKLVYDDKKELDRFLQYLTFKMQCAAEQEQYGWRLDLPLAQKMFDKLSKLQDEKVEELKGVMPRVEKFKLQKKPQNPFKKDGTPSVAGQRWFELLDNVGLDRIHEEPVKVLVGMEEPNPNSSDQVKDWLYSLGWEPCTFKYVKDKTTGDERKVPQVRKDGELAPSVQILAEENPEIRVLEGLTVIQHRLGIFKGFLECERNGWLKAEVDGLTNTLRFKHKKPLVNLPGVDKPFGKEIRGCLIAPDDNHVLCGADMSSLESMTKRHYIYPYDPDYVEEMSKPGFDEHLDLAVINNALSKEDYLYYTTYPKDKEPDERHKQIHKLRKSYKPVNYGSVYGIGAPKLARETGMSVEKCKELIEAYWKRNHAVKKFAEDQKVKTVNKQMWIRNPVSGFWYSLRFEKDRFSTLNQSTGVYCFDRWVALCRKNGLTTIGQFHDEIIVPTTKGDEERTEKIMKLSIEKLNQQLDLNVQLDIEAQFGRSYADIH